MSEQLLLIAVIASGPNLMMSAQDIDGVTLTLLNSHEACVIFTYRLPGGKVTLTETKGLEGMKTKIDVLPGKNIGCSSMTFVGKPIEDTIAALPRGARAQMKSLRWLRDHIDSSVRVVTS